MTDDLAMTQAFSEAIAHELCNRDDYAMGLPCEVVIRVAESKDRARFAELYGKLLSDPRGQGSYLPTERNLTFFLSLFDAYVSGAKDGVVLIVDEGACLMWGDLGVSDAFDTRYGRAAAGLGTYLEPALRGKGLAGKMWDVAKEKIREKGFDVVVGSVPIGNEPSQRALAKLGIIPTDVQFLIDVKRG